MSFIMKKSAYNVLYITHTKNYTTKISYMKNITFFCIKISKIYNIKIGGYYEKASSLENCDEI